MFKYFGFKDKKGEAVIPYNESNNLVPMPRVV